ncbi:MAG TPA: cold shock domain-containing protein [Desulfovibrio sp.]|jgi:cold-shock DNA-binding protein family|uniref:cold shock domain-containing protein n=1 Tax=Desulfovibrio TaxID=872 RepID=UPI0004071153|nr:MULTISPECIES: cold shock domain-containing protein [Desulfovibrio]MDY0304990.1 cold shock domain-containing protein [Desulfovibrionaceae bacterium]HMM39046.1 cold shock domain-containing protein [Desulfovibrio sp.]
MRQNGVVSWFDERKGFGFITDSEGRDVFVHYSEIVREGFQTLEEGERVSFELASGGEARKAQNVVPLRQSSML